MFVLSIAFYDIFLNTAFSKDKDKWINYFSVLLMKVLIFSLQLILLCSFFQFTACKSDKKNGKSSNVDTAAIRASIGEAPVISPEESIKKIQLEDGFDIKLVAAEPLVILTVGKTRNSEYHGTWK